MIRQDEMRTCRGWICTGPVGSCHTYISPLGVERKKTTISNAPATPRRPGCTPTITPRPATTARRAGGALSLRLTSALERRRGLNPTMAAVENASSRHSALVRPKRARRSNEQQKQPQSSRPSAAAPSALPWMVVGHGHGGIGRSLLKNSRVRGALCALQHSGAWSTRQQRQERPNSRTQRHVDRRGAGVPCQAARDTPICVVSSDG